MTPKSFCAFSMAINKMTKMTNDRNTKNRLTPYGVSLIVLDFPVTFHQRTFTSGIRSCPEISCFIGNRLANH